MQENLVILVDEHNNELWTMEKLEAHEKWVLHRAFSIFLFNDVGELLIQQRDMWKYHCGGLWANTVCSHQKPGEWNLHAAVRRVWEELWIYGDIKNLMELWSITYRAEFDNGLTEHEYDFIIKWEYDGIVSPNPEEVMDYKWVKLDELRQDMKENPDIYTPWFKAIMKSKKYF